MFLIDSHCHIDRLNYNLLHKNIGDVLKKAYKNNVCKILTVSTSINNFYKIQKITDDHNSIFYSCGIHPTNCHKEINLLGKLEKLSNVKRVIALGETGLDYYHSIEYKKLQKSFFREHIRISLKNKKPIIVHTRHAIKDTLKILYEQDSKNCTGVLHSFTEDYSSACKLLDLGFYISCSGIITFKNSTCLQDTIKKIPLNRLLIETDAPYLSPVPHRGKENQPAYLLDIAKKIAILKKIDLEKIAYVTTKNFYKLFNL